MANSDEFWNFLGAWFPDADLEGVEDDAQVVRNFIDTGNHVKIHAVVVGLRDVLNSNPLPVERISDEANRYFENEGECRDWLQMCLTVFSEHASA
jgi:hypothetical protein